jgi:hypothetical protein
MGVEANPNIGGEIGHDEARADVLEHLTPRTKRFLRRAAKIAVGRYIGGVELSFGVEGQPEAITRGAFEHLSCE